MLLYRLHQPINVHSKWQVNVNATLTNYNSNGNYPSYLKLVVYLYIN